MRRKGKTRQQKSINLGAFLLHFARIWKATGPFFAINLRLVRTFGFVSRFLVGGHLFFFPLNVGILWSCRCTFYINVEKLFIFHVNWLMFSYFYFHEAKESYIITFGFLYLDIRTLFMIFFFYNPIFLINEI